MGRGRHAVLITAADPTHHLASLNEAFPGWGEAADYAWWFERRAGGPPADVFQLCEGGEIVAGSAVTYRTLTTAGGQCVPAAVMTGSWTRPYHRRRGVFARVIAHSRELAAARDAPVLLGFAGARNPSVRSLVAESADTQPSWYLVSGPGTKVGEASAVVPGDAVAMLPRIGRLWEQQASGRPHFAYPGEALAGQLLGRPRPAEMLEAAGGCAVVEPRDPHDRLLLLCGPPWEAGAVGTALAALVARARGRGRELFAFTTRRDVRDAAVTQGFAARDGIVLVLATGAAPPPSLARCDFQDVDRA